MDTQPIPTLNLQTFDLRLQCSQCRIERLARAHGGGDELFLRAVVAADINRLALNAGQFRDDLRFVLCKRFCQRREAGFQFRIFVLRGECFGPVEREVEMASAVVEFADFARRRFVFLQELRVSGVERVGQMLPNLFLHPSPPRLSA